MFHKPNVLEMIKKRRLLWAGHAWLLCLEFFVSHMTGEESKRKEGTGVTSYEMGRYDERRFLT